MSGTIEGGNQTVFDLENVTWDDIFENDEGVVQGVFGIHWRDLSAKQVRTLASRLKLKGVKNAKKEILIQALNQTYNLKKDYTALQSGENGLERARKQVQCSYRLLNILFSDQFANDFARLGDVASRQLLDTGLAASDEHFWVGVQEAFIQPNEDYDQLEFLDDEYIADHDYIDPGDIVQHDWKKLRSIWKKLNSDYKAALARFTVSGTHDSNFYSFCNGKLDVYYLRKYLEVRPDMNDFVIADLPAGCALSSTMTADALVQNFSAGSDRDKSTNGSTPSKHRTAGNDIAEAIREFGNASMRSEMAKQKLRYMEMDESRREKEEVRHEKEEARRENEEKRRDNEERRREKEESRQERKTTFEEWEKIQANIRMFQKDLSNPALDEEMKEELKEDIAGMKKQKNDLAQLLGLK